ncbi:MAG: HlyD family type I secretion periplasmic adaptor subunit [Victivallaceae bacterium]|nr:HlyD family type I secretion periplasmic adaptor subunit [Victivallaceae bacterium]
MKKTENRNNIAPDAIEYQSDALELEHKKLPWFGRCGILFIALLMTAVVIWASVCKVDTVVEANGKLIAVTQNITMKPLERTVIKKINVVVGQVVKKNQVLITFDPTFNQAEKERLEEQLQSLEAQYARLNAECKTQNYPISSGKNVTNDMRSQMAIFQKRAKFRQQQLLYFTQNMSQIEASIYSNKASYTKQQERLKALWKIEQMFDKLYRKQSISLKQLLETQISRLQMESEVDKLKNRTVELKHELLSAEASKNSFIAEWNKNISEEMVSVEREINGVEKQLDKAIRLNSLVVLRAPAAAVVHEIAQFSAGSGVREAEPLITLVPINCKIEVEANIVPRDIGKVKIGDEVRIKLNAFPFQKHGTLVGNLRIISENTFQDGAPMLGGQKQAVYHARIVIAGKLENVPDNFRLIPGMELRAEIKVGKRRIISYLLHPLIKALDESIREP